MAPDPPHVDSEHLRSVSSELLMMAINSDDSDGYDDIDYNSDIVSLGYTLFTGGNDMLDSNDNESDDDDNFEFTTIDRSVEELTMTLELDNPSTSQNSSLSLSNNSRNNGLDEFIHDDYISSVQPRTQEEEEKDFEDASCSTKNADRSRSDITVNCDQVKAAMVGFTLPPSAIPDWAQGVTDQDIASYIKSLLLKSNSSK